MVFKVKVSEQAAADLADIIRYMNDELCNFGAAERFYNTANEKLSLLREQPYMFPLCRDEKLNAEGIRFVAIGNFLMFYITDDERSVVSVVRILYGKRDIPSLFEKQPPTAYTQSE